MNNIHLSILGSKQFLNILNELEFSDIINSSHQQNYNDKEILVRIIFAENLKIKEVKDSLLQNYPTILFVSSKDYIKKNNFKLLNFHAGLEMPIEISSFREILNILITKYNFFKKSSIIIKDYKIDYNERSIMHNKLKIKVKLTEKELELILALKNKNGLNKSFLLKSIWKYSSDLDTHAFETHLHRLRKKINKHFQDKNFIIEKNSLYYLTN